MNVLDCFEVLLIGGDQRIQFKPFLEAIRRRWPEERGVRIELLYYNQEQEYLEQIEQIGFDKTREVMQVRWVPAGGLGDGLGICAFAASRRESVLVPEVRFDRRYVSVQEEDSDNTESELAVPLLIGDRLLGVLNLEAGVSHAFGNEDLRYCKQLSTLLAVLIDYETYRLEEIFLQESESSIALLMERDRVLSELLERVLALIGPECLGCVLVPIVDSGDIKGLRVVASHGLNLEVGEERSLDTFGVIREALSCPSREKYWRNLANGEAAYVELAPGIRSEFALALEAEGQVIALINVESSSPTISERYRRAIRRMGQHTAVMLHSLQRKGDLERQQGTATILKAAKMEAHTLRNITERLIPALGNLQGQLSPRKMGLAQDLLKRIRELDSTLVGYLETGFISLQEVVRAAREQAERIEIELDYRGAFDVLVKGSRNGFICIFENLLLNTSKHGGGGRLPKAYISSEVKDGHGILRYWDDGEADLENFDPATFMNRHAGQGLQIIEALCQSYEWQVRPGRRGRSLEYTFEFRCLKVVSDV